MDDPGTVISCQCQDKWPRDDDDDIAWAKIEMGQMSGVIFIGKRSRARPDSIWAL